MTAWICSTSGRMALRVRTMGLLHGRQFLARLLQRIFHSVRRRSSGNIVAGNHGLQREMLIDVRAKCGTEFLQLSQGQILELASSLYAFLNRVGDDFMRLT